MSLVKHDEISVREFIVRRHQFQLKRRTEKRSSRTYDNEGKGLSADEFYRLVLKERKNHAACVPRLCACYLLFDPRYQRQDN